MRRNKSIYTLAMVCVFGAGVCGYGLYQEIRPRLEAERSYEWLREQMFPEAEDGSQPESGMADGTSDQALMRGRPDFKALKAVNPDIVGWIWAPGTEIDYPVVQGEDNDYYLNHNADRSRNLAGAIFMEWQNGSEFQDDVTVLYGHHIRGGRMFSSLSGYKQQSYYEEHPVLYLYTPETEYRVELFAGEILDGQTGSFPLVFDGDPARDSWLDKIARNSTFQADGFPGAGEQILALCTCSYEYEDARYTVYGILNGLETDWDVGGMRP